MPLSCTGGFAMKTKGTALECLCCSSKGLKHSTPGSNGCWVDAKGKRRIVSTSRGAQAHHLIARSAA
ncbi:unnamed protein product, partial [Chrysoparadoxa australica]